MGIRLSAISLSKYTVLVAVQLVLNVSLAIGLYNEYLHNPFMQTYLSSLWSSISPVVIVGVGAATGIAVVLTLYNLDRLPMFVKRENASSVGPVAIPTSLETIDVCPFCETPLKTISEGRHQCRNCRRYFKSSMPRILA